MKTSVTLCVDALETQMGGIGRYTWELCKGLRKSERVTVRYFGHGRLIDDPSSLLRGEPVPSRSSVLRWWDKRAVRSAIVHGPNYFLPADAETGIITVHDLSVFRFPETHPAERIRAFEREFLKSLSRAAHVITDTQSIRNELIDTFGISPSLVSAVPLGVDPKFHPRPAAGLAKTLEFWGLEPAKYGLCVSTLEPRKKISEMLEAWRALPRLLRDRFPLVLCGGAGWLNDELLIQVHDGVAENWLHHLGFVDEGLLPDLYAGAALFVYPSIYEGFGLPPLEAMASGVPCMVSHHSCLAEVCGEAARYFDPDDAAAFAAAIEANLMDGEWRARTVEPGLARARQFTWERCVAETVNVYQKVAVGE